VSLQQAQLDKKLADASKKANDVNEKNQKWKRSNCLLEVYKVVDPKAQEEISQSRPLPPVVNKKRSVKYQIKEEAQ
jgi:hypothetical protein